MLDKFLLLFPDAMQLLGILFGMAMSIMLIFVMALSMRDVRLEGLITAGNTNKVSHTRFWANVAYLVVTLAFLRVNFDVQYNQYLPELWLIYMGVVASNASVSKFLSLRYGNHTPDYPPSQRKTGHDGPVVEDDYIPELDDYPPRKED